MEVTLGNPGLSIKGRLSFDTMNFRDVTRAKGAYTYRYVTNEDEPDLSKGTYIRVEEGTNTLDYSVNANGNKKSLQNCILITNAGLANMI